MVNKSLTTLRGIMQGHREFTLTFTEEDMHNLMAILYHASGQTDYKAGSVQLDTLKSKAHNMWMELEQIVEGWGR